MRARAAFWTSGSGMIGGLMLAVATPATAQRQVQVTPFIAGYYSLGDLGNYVDPSVPGGQALQNSGMAIGASVSVALTDRLGGEASVAYAFSDPRVQVCDTDGFCGYMDLGGSLVITSVAARFRPARSNFLGLAGLTLVSRGGEAWEDLETKTAVGGMIGAGVLAQVAPKFVLDVRGELRFYSFDPDGSGASWDPALATDVLVRIGVPFPGR